MMITGLVKYSTTAPMKKSKVMPVHKFHDLFMSWPDNCGLNTKDLRLKAVALLALTLMLRPSDAAPKGKFHTADGPSDLVFSGDQVEFSENGATFTLFDIRNDTSRSGFEVCIPRASVEKIDPIATLEAYIARTNSNRAVAGPVLISLRAPYAANTASSIARILEESKLL